jgi:hypothetical protein
MAGQLSCGEVKVFWFFFSKKNILPAFLWPGIQRLCWRFCFVPQAAIGQPGY